MLVFMDSSRMLMMLLSPPTFRAGVVAARNLARVSVVAGVLIVGTATVSRADEQRVVFGRSIAVEAISNGTPGWSIRVQGRVFEPAEESRKRQLVIDGLAPVLGGHRGDPLYRERAGHFVSDSVRNVRVSIAIGDRIVELPSTDASGCFVADIALGADEAARLKRDGELPFRSRPAKGRSGSFDGIAVAVPQGGVTVITDIDDTIKETNIPNHAEAKANTFVRPFRPVPGMADLYRAWENAGDGKVHFHVVSAGPWHFHEPLQQFAADAGFPLFTWDMRCIDVANPTRLIRETLISNPERLRKFKVAAIRALMLRLPKRHVVLVGDSGERDPEAYSDIVREFGKRVDAVYIRNIGGHASGTRNYDKLFPSPGTPSKLKVFDTPDELPRDLAVSQ